jgi:hypothetical protein
MAETNDSNQRTRSGTAGTTQDLLVDGLQACTIHSVEDGTWHVLAQLASEEQAALAAAAPTPDELCRRAQHALGLAAIGSRIYPERSAVGVYLDRIEARLGEPALLLDGPAVLWFVAHAAPEAIRALLHAATHLMRQAPAP